MSEHDERKNRDLRALLLRLMLELAKLRGEVMTIKDQVAAAQVAATKLKTDFETFRDTINQKLADAIASATDPAVIQALTDLQTSLDGVDQEVLDASAGVAGGTPAAT